MVGRKTLHPLQKANRTYSILFARMGRLTALFLLGLLFVTSHGALVELEDGPVALRPKADTKTNSDQGVVDNLGGANPHQRQLRAALAFGETLNNVRKLQFTCEEICEAGHKRFVGDCGGLGNRRYENWCPTETQGDVCCAGKERECCKLSGGGIALLVIGIPLLIGLIIFVSSW